MSYIEKFKSGIYMTTASFSLIWRHKHLLIYFAIPTILNIGMYLVTYNIVITPIEKQLPIMADFHDAILLLFPMPGWFYYVGAFVAFFLSILIKYFFIAALIHRTMHVFKDEHTTIAESIKSCFPKLGIIALWSLVSTIQFSLIQLLSMASDSTISFSSSFLILLSVTITIVWSLFTLLVLPIITIEKTNILRAVVRSGVIVTKQIFKIFGGEVWIGFLTVLSVIPFLSLSYLPSYLTVVPIAYLGLINIISALSIIIINCIISTAHTIFKTGIYDQYMRPEQELSYLKYPHL